MTEIAVRTISTAEHLDYVTSRSDVSFLQTPAWGEVKSEWERESLGWFEGSSLVGTGLVLYRKIPRLNKSLAYLPEGPVLDWGGPHLGQSLAVMADHVHERGAFGVRIGPPVAIRSWTAETVKRAIADPGTQRLGAVPPDATHADGEAACRILRASGWSRQSAESGFAAGQPPIVFQVPLEGRPTDDVLAGMNQQWRRNIKRAAKSGVVVSRGAPDDLARFHALYAETAARDDFTARPVEYFRQMFQVLQREDPDRIRLYLAEHEGTLVAAATWVKVGGHTWYSYGASSTAKRDVRGSNAIQWQMIRDSIDAGASVYDMRGITDTLDPDDPQIGLIQFKVGTGGEAVEYAGEWDLPLSRLVYKGFALYMSRR